uniref:ATP-dependent DNA helicase n=1 Tax=Tanacetum cinerariifolium TaxID=118510 RepID=A0A6L2MBY7_TANCI|nr:DNA helicase PIF1, ATP-dependent [Tanacetum cinerariifolium]
MQPCGMRKEITKETRIKSQDFHSAANKDRPLINKGMGLYTFRINRHNYHRIGSLLPTVGTQPRYAQLWFFDTHNEIQNRLGAFMDTDSEEGVDGTIVGSQIRMLDANSAIAKSFRMARDWCHGNVTVNVELHLLSERTSSKQYNAPTVTEVAALITNDFGDGEPTRDIVVCQKDSPPNRISELHPSYMALQYPLLFPYGEDGYHEQIPYHTNKGKRKTARDYVTMKEYYAYVIPYRKDQCTTLHRGGRLFQQYLVDVSTAIKEQRLSWTRNNQDTLRVDLYHNVVDAITRGDTYATGLGLPPAHILLWLEEYYRCKAAMDIDGIISAELPCPTTDKIGYKAVLDYMLHGPCGKDNRAAACNIEGKCSKHFLKPFYVETVIDQDGYLIYRRRDDKVSVKKDQKVTMVDEIKNYLNCRYLAPCEAVWRIFSFDIHHSYPSVMKLNFHLQNQQPVTLHDTDCLSALLQKKDIDVTMFTDWRPRKFEHLLIVNDKICATFKEACFTYGLLNDDKEWTRAIQEASLWALGPQLRDLFVTILLFCDVSRPLKLWEENWEVLFDDILHKKRLLFKYPELQLTTEQIQKYRLMEIQDLLNTNGRALSEFTDTPQPNPALLTSLNPRQRLIYEEVVASVHNKKGRFHFVYGPGGTGKTFLYKTIISRLRSELKIVLAVASSGIASLLLPGGRTAHSRQILSVVPKGKRADIVQACINRSKLWKHCKVSTLKRSMSVNEYNSDGALDTRKQMFNQWVLVVGDGKVPARIKDREDEPTWIEIPETFLIPSSDSPIQQIVKETYPNFIQRQKDDVYIREREILTPRNDDVDAINAYMFDKLAGQTITYHSANEICKGSTETLDQHNLYPTEFLNTLNFQGMPPTL